eukprot:GFUD01016976.1.p1 GENE.GFUD01016976.1~~GFUD01016976.1.p1  ORF type:complete len:694 (+),score=255.48 GFUD01016976.1:36-2117(+)
MSSEDEDIIPGSPELLRSSQVLVPPLPSITPPLDLPRSENYPHHPPLSPIQRPSPQPSPSRDLQAPTTPERVTTSPTPGPDPDPISPIIRTQAQNRTRSRVVNGGNDSVVHAISDTDDESRDGVDNHSDDQVEAVEIPPQILINNDTPAQGLDASALDFQEGPATAPSNPLKVGKVVAKVKKNTKGKKRKAADSVDDESEEGSCCTICFESWSNSGDHRISSLRCGHFFGYLCIERWLRGAGASCPNCNEKSTKKDIRVHYVSKLAAIDTSERDRAVGDLEKVRGELRELQLRQTELQVRLKLQQEKIDKLEGDNRRFRERGGELPPPSLIRGGAGGAVGGGGRARLVYQKRHEICRPGTDRDKCCRVLACSEYHGMIVISQPSANPLFPGFGVRRFNMLDQKVGSFVGLGREVVRDLAFHPTTPELLLSCGQGKVARITNISSCSEVVKFSCDSEVWAGDWARGGPGTQLYLGTKRSQVLVHDTRDPQGDPTVLTFPGTERRPIISLISVPACPAAGLPHPGLLVLTLGSLWFWEHRLGDNTFTPHRLPTPQGATFWSLEYEETSRLVLLVCRPSPLSTHLVMELTSTTLPTGRVVTTNTIMTSQGGSYSARSFLRSSLVVTGGEEGMVLLVFSRGTGLGDQKVIVQEVGTGRIQQELPVGKPVLDIKQATINQQNFLAILGDTELVMYKWE